jgi:citrate lyase beta subunit
MSLDGALIDATSIRQAETIVAQMEPIKATG